MLSDKEIKAIADSIFQTLIKNMRILRKQPVSTPCKCSKTKKVTNKTQKKPGTRAKTERNAKVVVMYKKGSTPAAIANKFKISKPRVWQVLRALGVR